MVRNRSFQDDKVHAQETESANPSRFDSLEAKLDALEAKLEDHWLEILTVVLLGVASLAAAWGGYQSARWGGVQSTLYASAGATRVESVRSESTSQLLALTDLSIVLECSDVFDTEEEIANALADPDPDQKIRTAIEDCYSEQFSPSLMTAMNAWSVQTTETQIETSTGSYADGGNDTGGQGDVEERIREEHAEAKMLKSEAGQLFADGQAANQQSDDYVLTTVFLAMVLFLGGISTRLKWMPLQIGFVGFAMTLLILSLVRMASFPIA